MASKSTVAPDSNEVSVGRDSGRLGDIVGENRPRTAVGYFPTIPENPHTAAYNHPLALGQAVDDALIITHQSAPEAIRDCARTVVIDGDVPTKARKASKLARAHLEPGDPFVTTFHYEAVTAGVLASLRRCRWVVDCWDAPVQYRLNNPETHHELTSRCIEKILKFADKVVHVSSASTPHTFGRRSEFITNGAPVKTIDCKLPEKRTGELNVVWLGSPRLDRGGALLVDALTSVDADVTVDVYGGNHEETALLGAERGVDNVTFHGQVSPVKCIEASQSAHAGFCVLPSREDWMYATPIKLGEYLAGGALPLVSDFPGMHLMANGTGEYVNPTSKSVAAGLERLAGLNDSEYRRRASRGRVQAERISWTNIRQEYCSKILG